MELLSCFSKLFRFSCAIVSAENSIKPESAYGLMFKSIGGGKYNEQGKLTPKDLNLSSKTKLEEIINEYIVKQINHKLKEKSDEVYHAISIYEYSIFVVALLFLLAAILIAFGRASASVPLAIASVGSFMALWIAANDITTVLQANVYSGLRVTLSQGVWIGLIVGLATTILWPILLKVTKEVKVKK